MMKVRVILLSWLHFKWYDVCITGLSCNEGELIIDNQSREHKVVAGGLQLCFGGSFINICHTFNSNEIWKENEASVACRQLGYGGIMTT